MLSNEQIDFLADNPQFTNATSDESGNLIVSMNGNPNRITRIDKDTIQGHSYNAQALEKKATQAPNLKGYQSTGSVQEGDFLRSIGKPQLQNMAETIKNVFGTPIEDSLYGATLTMQDYNAFKDKYQRALMSKTVE